MLNILNPSVRDRQHALAEQMIATQDCGPFDTNGKIRFALSKTKGLQRHTAKAWDYHQNPDTEDLAVEEVERALQELYFCEHLLKSTLDDLTTRS